MCRWYLVGGRDRLKELVRSDFETVPWTSTMALMWMMTKPLWVTGKTVIMESGLCVLKVLIGIYKRGVYGSLVAKKRRYWPGGIYGYQINAHFEK